METTSRDSCAEMRVGDGTADVANQPGLCTQGSFDIKYDPSVLVEDLVYTQQEDLAKTVIEDEISPDDAPEVVWDDTNEEVCTIVS